jgi:hypothetical protein
MNESNYDPARHAEYAKFVQNLLLEDNIKCYLIGGALINSLRDDGKLSSNDIDFALILNDNLNRVLNVLQKSMFAFYWNCQEYLLTIYPCYDEKYRIDLFLFIKRNVNYYMHQIEFMHEKICSFQTFKQQKVLLENKEFITMFRPDLFLTTIYGDWSKPNDQYISKQGGNTDHIKECIFYTDKNNYDILDFQIENLKLLFKEVVVKRNLANIDEKKINIFDDIYTNCLPKETTLFYNDFIKFFIKEDIKYLDV